MSKKAIIACIIAAAVLLLGIAAAVMVLYSDGAPSETEVNGRTVSLNRLRISSRGTKGTKIRK